MKFFRCSILCCFLVLTIISCSKNQDKDWRIEVKTPAQEVEITDISKELYDTAVSTEAFKLKYPWFQGSVSDEDFAKRRLDPKEIEIYKEAVAKIDVKKLSKDLTSLFAHIQHYFPKFVVPKVYIFSSALQMADDPIIYNDEQKLLFIDISGFMGSKNTKYKGLEHYFLTSMNPENLVPKVSRAIAEVIAPYVPGEMKFIDEMVYEGKLLTLQDAFLPEVPDHLKINYSKEQYDWAWANEDNVWNYFVENNLVFSDDQRLVDRFISIGPYSKFYTEIDTKSSPRIGTFTGWRICRAFFANKKDATLVEFLQMPGQEIFSNSQYKPKVSE